MTVTGTHIIADLHGCDFSHYISRHDLAAIEQHIKDMVTEAGLTVVGEASHIFGKDSFTLAILLAESHLTMHTWPESGYISLDIFVCNYSKENTAAAHDIFDRLEELCKPEHTEKQIIER